MLKDGSDSVGALGALNRVYLNIGTFSEEWLLHFNPAGRRQARHADRNRRPRGRTRRTSQATEAQTPDTALFFLKSTAPASPQRRARRRDISHQGRKHADARQGRVRGELRALPFEQDSPKPRPGSIPAAAPARTISAAGTTTGSGPRPTSSRPRCGQIVTAPDFLDNNYLSAEFRVPVTLLHTNACSPLATNAIGGNIWDNFSSQSYKDLPSVGEIIWYHPVTGEPSATPCRPAAAAIPGRLAHQPVVHRALPAQ